MRTHNSYEYGRREFHRGREEDGAFAVTLFAVAALASGSCLLACRLHVRPLQLAELAFYLACLIAVLLASAWYLDNRRKRIAMAWPHPPLFVHRLRDDRL